MNAPPSCAPREMCATDWDTYDKHKDALILLALVNVRTGHVRNSSEYDDITQLLRGHAWAMANRTRLAEADLWLKVMANAARSHCDPGWAELEIDRSCRGPATMPFSDELSNVEIGKRVLAGVLFARLLEVGSLPAQPPECYPPTSTELGAWGIGSLSRSASGALVEQLVQRIAEADTAEQIRSALIAFEHSFERAGQALPSGRLPVLDVARELIGLCDTFDVEEAGAVIRAASAHQPSHGIG
ncbi:hypothetical protein [Stenotrophomonas sp. PS02289]|uniref:hypothetical protein n=1 Tax=Stenotrophomonas sp. PS02289 TaxID=2991422 RepID=UPI00249A652F|nr:hypothetical protein [Stenotrophomonas sp. PS02289]